MDNKSKIILIAGPTASGKSNFAIKLAQKINGEIINADSMQVYNQFKILTARPNKKDERKIKHHLYGIIKTGNNFSTGQWLKLVIKKIKEIKKRNKVPILVGGTGLYFHSLINGLVKIPNISNKIRNKIRLLQKKEGQNKFYQRLLKLDPKIKDRISHNDVQRSIRAFEVKSQTKISIYDWIIATKPKYDNKEFLKLYLDFNRQDLIKKISKRIDIMIKKGVINEVKKFNKSKFKSEQSISKVIGIDEFSKYLNKEIKLDEAKKLISIRTRQYAKRQSTWARSKMESWIKIDPNEILYWIKKLNKSSLKLDQ